MRERERECVSERKREGERDRERQQGAESSMDAHDLQMRLLAVLRPVQPFPPFRRWQKPCDAQSNLNEPGIRRSKYGPLKGLLERRYRYRCRGRCRYRI